MMVPVTDELLADQPTWLTRHLATAVRESVAAMLEDMRLTAQIGPLHLPGRYEIKQHRDELAKRRRRRESATVLVRRLRATRSLGELRRTSTAVTRYAPGIRDNAAPEV